MSIWINAGLPPVEQARLARALTGRDVHWAPPTASVLEAGHADPSLATATIAFGQPDPDALRGAARLRLIQLTSAGYTRYDRSDLTATLVARGTVLCNASSVYADPVAEHGIAMLLGLLRRLPESVLEQAGPRRWRYHELRAGSRRLAGETVLFLGFGAIARAMVERLRPFGAHFIGFRRRPRGDEGIPIVDESGLDAALAEADHVFDLLPEGPQTKNFVDGRRLARMRPTARFYNLGRGATVDQAALREALLGDRLDAAWLDVTSPEPLPPDDPLWSTPRLYISPHSAGGHADEQARHVDLFLHNLAALEAGRPLRDRVV